MILVIFLLIIGLAVTGFRLRGWAKRMLRRLRGWVMWRPRNLAVAAGGVFALFILGSCAVRVGHGGGQPERPPAAAVAPTTTPTPADGYDPSGAAVQPSTQALTARAQAFVTLWLSGRDPATNPVQWIVAMNWYLQPELRPTVAVTDRRTIPAATVATVARDPGGDAATFIVTLSNRSRYTVTFSEGDDGVWRIDGFGPRASK